MNQPTSPVKIKSPSKLFKHLSPKVKDPVNPLGPIHFVNTITTVPASTPNLNQQQTGNMGHTAKDETSRLDHTSAKIPTNSFEQSATHESSKSDEGKERLEVHTRNPVILGKSIMEEPERKTKDVTSGSSDRTEKGNSKVYKISCTIKKKLLTDSHIDPSLPINIIPLFLYHEAFPERMVYKKVNNARVIKDLSIMIGGLIYNIDLTVVDDIDPVTNLTLTNLVLGRPFIHESGVILDEKDGSALFTNGVKKVIFRWGNEEVYEYRPSLEGNLYGSRDGGSGRIRRRDPNNLKIPCMIGHKYFDNVYINVFLPKNFMSLFHYKNICRWGMIYKGENVVGRDHEIQVFVGNMAFAMEFTIVDNIEDYVDPRLSQVVFGAPFVKSLI